MNISDIGPTPTFNGLQNINDVANNNFYYPSTLNSSGVDYTLPQSYFAGGTFPYNDLWDTHRRSNRFQSADLKTETSVPAPTQALGFSRLNPPEIQTHQTPLFPRAVASSHEAWSRPAAVKGSSRGRDQRVINRRRKRTAKEVCLACNGLDFTVKRSLENHIMAAHLGMRFSCPIEGCGKNYPHMSSLGRHIREKHSGIMQDYVGTLT